MSKLKQTWAAGESTLGFWLTSNSAVVAESAVDLGFDYVNIDMQHGFSDYADVVDMMRAMVPAAASTITCRVPWNEPGVIGRVLDAGAMGSSSRWSTPSSRPSGRCRHVATPPAGARSFGPVRAARVNGPEYHATANERVACIPMIETVEALSNLDAILSVPGIDAVYVGPADLSLTLGLAPQGDHDDASFKRCACESRLGMQTDAASSLASTPTRRSPQSGWSRDFGW